MKKKKKHFIEQGHVDPVEIAGLADKKHKYFQYVFISVLQFVAETIAIIIKRKIRQS